MILFLIEISSSAQWTHFRVSPRKFLLWAWTPPARAAELLAMQAVPGWNSDPGAASAAGCGVWDMPGKQAARAVL